MAIVSIEAAARFRLFTRLVYSYEKTRREDILLDIRKVVQVLDLMGAVPSAYSDLWYEITGSFQYAIRISFKLAITLPEFTWDLLSYIQNITQDTSIRKPICGSNFLGYLLSNSLFGSTEGKGSLDLNLLYQVMLPDMKTMDGSTCYQLICFLFELIKATKNHINELRLLVHFNSIRPASRFCEGRNFEDILGKVYNILVPEEEQSIEYKLVANLLLMQINFVAMNEPENYPSNLFEAMLEGNDTSTVKIAFEAFIRLCEKDLHHFLDKYEEYPELFESIHDKLNSSDLDDSELYLVIRLIILILKNVDRLKVINQLSKLFQVGINASTRAVLAPVALQLCTCIHHIIGKKDFCNIILPLGLSNFNAHLKILCNAWLNKTIYMEEECQLKTLLQMKLLVPKCDADGDVDLDILTDMIEEILKSSHTPGSSIPQMLSSLLLILHKEFAGEPPEDSVQKFLLYPSCQSILCKYLEEASDVEYAQLFNMFIENDCLGSFRCTRSETQCKTSISQPGQTKTKGRQGTAVPHLIMDWSVSFDDMEEDPHLLEDMECFQELHELKLSNLKRQIVVLESQQASLSQPSNNDDCKLSGIQTKMKTEEKSSELKTKVHTLQETNFSLQYDLKDAKDKLARKKKAICHLKEDLKKTQQHIDDLKLTETRMKKMVDERGRKIKDLSSVINELKNKNTQLLESLKSLKFQSCNQSKVIDSQEKQKQTLLKDLSELNMMKEQIHEITAGKTSNLHEVD